MYYLWKASIFALWFLPLHLPLAAGYKIFFHNRTYSRKVEKVGIWIVMSWQKDFLCDRRYIHCWNTTNLKIPYYMRVDMLSQFFYLSLYHDLFIFFFCTFTGHQPKPFGSSTCLMCQFSNMRCDDLRKQEISNKW